MQELQKNRIQSIDILRGIAMVLMALDHVRDYFHIAANTGDPLNLETTTPFLFLTRWITHYCAPTFVFLSGTSIFLQSRRKSAGELGTFLLKRGIWLIIAEWTLIAFAWTFNPFFNILPMQVIWAIGSSMVIMGLLVLLRIPFNALLTIGLLIVFGHNLLDIPESVKGFKPQFIWDLLHYGSFQPYEFVPGHSVLIAYPFPPWTGLMILGYCFGILFTEKFTAESRRKILVRGGWGLIVFFIALRYSNLYGNPFDWSGQKNFLYTLLSFIDTHKYPPSLLYMCMTIGPALLLIAYFENVKNKFTEVMNIFGRTAFFYYILHLYLIHTLATIVYFVNGHTMDEVGNSIGKFPFLFVVSGEGFGLGAVYLVWLAVIAILYPLCKKYDRYKTLHKEKWWLSYL
jgi:uncharacterized membrane protein